MNDRLCLAVIIAKATTWPFEALESEIRRSRRVELRREWMGSYAIIES